MSGQYCFVCASNEGVFLDVTPDNRNTFGDQIETCLSSKINECIDLSSKICYKCAYELDQCAKFVQKYKKSHEISERRAATSKPCCFLCHELVDSNRIFDITKDNNVLFNPLQKIRSIFNDDVSKKNIRLKLICLSCRYNLDVLYDLRRVYQETIANLKALINEEINYSSFPKVHTDVVNRKTTITTFPDITFYGSVNSDSDSNEKNTNMARRGKRRLKGHKARINAQIKLRNTKSKVRNCDKCHGAVASGIDMYRFYHTGLTVCKNCWITIDPSSDKIRRSRQTQSYLAETKLCTVFLTDVLSQKSQRKKKMHEVEKNKNDNTSHESSQEEAKSAGSSSPSLVSSKRNYIVNGKARRGRKRRINIMDRSKDIEHTPSKITRLSKERTNTNEVKSTKASVDAEQQSSTHLTQRRGRKRTIDDRSSDSDGSLEQRETRSSKLNDRVNKTNRKKQKSILEGTSNARLDSSDETSNEDGRSLRSKAKGAMSLSSIHITKEREEISTCSRTRSSSISSTEMTSMEFKSPKSPAQSEAKIEYACDKCDKKFDTKLSNAKHRLTHLKQAALKLEKLTVSSVKEKQETEVDSQDDNISKEATSRPDRTAGKHTDDPSEEIDVNIEDTDDEEIFSLSTRKNLMKKVENETGSEDGNVIDKPEDNTARSESRVEEESANDENIETNESEQCEKSTDMPDETLETEDDKDEKDEEKRDKHTTEDKDETSVNRDSDESKDEDVQKTVVTIVENEDNVDEEKDKEIEDDAKVSTVENEKAINECNNDEEVLHEETPEVALASEIFDQFCNATTLKSILSYYRQLCELLKIRPNAINQFYPKLKTKLRSWKAQALWKKFDQRANHKCYNRGKVCPNTRVLIIGGGPCGLRTAIEAQLLGAKVVVVEKRDRMSRNNVLHLWPFVIQDLRGLGAKKFFGKFCAGSIDHISIRQLQCILLKVALILGVEFHENVSFDSLIQPPDNQEDGKIGWRAKTSPADHPVSQYEFDVLIGADGKRNTLEGFKRKEFRGKLAIAITANFINKRTEAEARVEEISGVAFIFNQKFFKELYQETGIDLENIVYYKDDTHYFVMTAKKHSLIDKGVILRDHADTAKLLAKENVDREALMLYAREAAEFSTEYQMMDMEFAVNHYGQPDVAMFDFTSMYAAENASRVLERHGHRLLMILVGDSLLEPFWPTGSGCARGFLSSLDAGWAIKGWGASLLPLEVIAERESIYRLLGQTTPENLNRDYAAYTLDPHTRYPNLNVRSVTPIQVRSLLDTDDPESIKQPAIQSEIDIPKKRKRRDLRADTQVHPDTLLRWLQKQVALYDKVHIEDMGASFKDGLAICAIVHRYRPDLIDFYSLNAKDAVKNNQLAFDTLEKELNIPPIMTGEEMVECDVPDTLAMFSYLTQIYEVFRGEIPYIKHPKLEPEAEECTAHPKQLKQWTSEEKATKARHSRSRHANENAHSYVDKKDNTVGRRSRKRRSTEKVGATMDRQPKVRIGHRRGSVDEEFSGRIKDFEDKLKGTTSSEKKPRDLLRAIGKIEKTDWNVKEIEKKIEENKMGRGVRHERVEKVPKWSREQFLARQIKMEKRGNDQRGDTYSKYADIDNTLKNIGKKIREGSALGYNKVSAMAEQFSNKNQDVEPKLQKSNTKPAVVLPVQGGSEMCHFCNKRVYLMERLSAEGKFFHRGCFRCEYCSISLRIGNHTFDREKNGGRFYCTQHFGLSGTMKTRVEKKKISLVNKENVSNAAATLKTPEKAKTSLEGIVGLDLLDRGQTPERIEFENLAEISDPEEAHSQMDEDEWTDRNFGASTAEMGSSDDISDMSDSDEDNEVFEEAIDQPLTTEGTLELAKNWTLRYSHPHATIGQSDTGSNEYEDSSDEYTSEDDESGTATEDEEDVRARELRKQEVWLKVPPRSSDTDTGSETEVVSSEEASTEESVENSATEISTDSEFEHDEATPTQHEIPEITINDSYVRKTRGAYVEPKKVQVKSKVISSINGNLTQDKRQQDISGQFLGDRTKNLESNKEVNCNVPASVDTNNCTPLLNPRKGDYLLNRTHSTGGIASRLSLELKKRYLLGGSALGGSVIKSGSASNVDTKLRNFTDAISQHQKLLNPAPEPSPTMQAFLQGTSKLRTNNAPLSPLSPTVLFSRQLSTDHCRNSSNDVAKPTTLIETSKAQQLPDLVKESSILKSKTAPNICNESSVKDGKLIDEQVFLQQANNLTKKASTASTVEDVKSSQTTEKVLSNNAEEGNGFRPRSPLHETSIVVPQVDWSRKNEDKDASSGGSEMDSDSLSSSDSNEAVEKQLAVNLSPPRLRIHSTDGDLLLDEGTDRYTKHYDPDDGQTFEPDSIEVSFLRDRRLLDPIDNTVEMVNNNMERLDLRDDNRKSNCSSPTSEASAMSNKQDDSEEYDVTTAAFTETEFSEWARDGEALVSDVELDINPNFITVRRNNAKLSCTPAKIAKEEDTELDYSKIDRLIDHEYPNNNTSKLLVNGEDINYMDTDNESLLDDSLQDASNIAMLKNRGYIEFVNIKTTLSNIPTSTNMCDLPVADAPIARLDLENDSYGEEEEEEGFKDANVIEIDPVTMEDVMGKLNEPNVSKSSMKSDIPVKELNEGEFKENAKREQLAEAFNKELLQSMEEDSLLLVEPAEDTTTSEVVTVLASPINPQVSIIPVETTEKREEPAKADSSNPDYLEYVKRLQSRIAEFSNAKDSIDVRKSRRKNSKSLAQTRTAEMIAEEIKCQETMNVTVDSNGVNSPATSRKLEEITRERSKQKNLIQDLLMDKLEAHKQKSAEKKARRAARASSFTTALSPIKPSLSNSSSVGNKFVPTSIISPVCSPTHTTFGEANKSLNLLMFSCPREQTDREEAKEKIPKKADEESITASLENSFKTPLAPPRLKSEEARRTAEKARQDARERARMKSDEDLGLSPEDRIKELRMKVTRRQLSMDDTIKDDTPKTERVKSYNFSAIDNSEPKLQISKSTDNMKNIAKKINFQKLPAAGAKSMDELLNTAGLSLSDNNSMAIKRDKKKQKDSERRKSIIQAVSDFFFKKETSPSPNQKDKLSMFRLTSKSKGKIDKTVSSKCDTRPKSVCEDMLVGNFLRENPPPVPPPPLNYSAYTTQVSDDSLSDDDTKTAALSGSCTQKAATEESCNSVSRKLKTAKKVARQAQLKRLRMAQEIQRKLEETEVKQKELESRGVSVEKALRGEGDSSNREEADLLREWFDLMKERTELRRYEKELLVRAQEVQLEDRHERLQQELRERLADDDDKKTSDDVKKEGEILTEMLEIVAKRDSLIALLEEERQRYQNEDRDLEAQMLAKGLRLTPIKKCGPKYSV